MKCTFFGHRNCPDSISAKLKNVLEELIKSKKASKFFVGNNGNFDNIAYNTLKKLKEKYPNIEYEVILAYVPDKPDRSATRDYAKTVVPDGIEKIPKRFAIIYRNNWMIKQSDIVVAYVRKSSGGASHFFELAKKKNKLCINLFDLCE